MAHTGKVSSYACSCPSDAADLCVVSAPAAGDIAEKASATEIFHTSSSVPRRNFLGLSQRAARIRLLQCVCTAVRAQPAPRNMLDFLLLVSRTGKLRLSKYYQDVPERDILQREVSALVLNRPARMCNFLECRGHKIVYKRCVMPGACPCCSRSIARRWPGCTRSRGGNMAMLPACCRYASLYFVVGVKADANELMVLEAVHHFVEVLDQYFGSVCELDIIFNFHRVCAGMCSVLGSGRCHTSAPARRPRPLLHARCTTCWMRCSSMARCRK